MMGDFRLKAEQSRPGEGIQGIEHAKMLFTCHELSNAGCAKMAQCVRKLQ